MLFVASASGIAWASHEITSSDEPAGEPREAALFVTATDGPAVTVPTVVPLPSPSPAPSPAGDAAELAYDPRVDSVAALLAGMPLSAYARQLVATADAYGIDWRYLPVIAILESSGGAAACGGNAWGYARCQVRFASFEQGMQTVAATLASRTYAGWDPATTFCIWVSGDGCTGAYAIGYARDAAMLYARLGGTMAVPAMPPESIDLPPYTPEAAGAVDLPPGNTTPSATPGSATPSTTPTPGTTATPAATEPASAEPPVAGTPTIAAPLEPQTPPAAGATPDE